MRRSLATLSAALLAGCAAVPVSEPPAVELPAQWKESAPRYAEDGRWWRIYEDPYLDDLVKESFAANGDLAVAVARVDEARALAAEARSFLLPTIDANASASRQRISTRTAVAPPGAPREFSLYSGALNVAYEVDLFGRLRSNAQAAAAEATASEAAREAVRLALAAEVAKSYFSLRALDEQVELLRQTLVLREDALRLQRRRREGGLIGDFELRQLEAEAAQARAQLPGLELAREQEEAALAVLLGRSPREIYEAGIARTKPGPQVLQPAVLPQGLPSELLLRRPDIVDVERRLAAAHARVAAARAEIFPSISLTAALGVESAALSNLFSSGAGFWTIAAGIAQPIFSGGRTEARTAAAEARERALVAQYVQTVRTAFAEVRSALAAQRRAREAYEAETQRAEALGEALRLAQLRYKSGVASQLEVLDAERGLLDARSARIDALRAQRAAIADLFRALGG